MDDVSICDTGVAKLLKTIEAVNALLALRASEAQGMAKHPQMAGRAISGPRMGILERQETPSDRVKTLLPPMKTVHRDVVGVFFHRCMYWCRCDGQGIGLLWLARHNRHLGFQQPRGCGLNIDDLAIHDCSAHASMICFDKCCAGEIGAGLWCDEVDGDQPRTFAVEVCIEFDVLLWRTFEIRHHKLCEGDITGRSTKPHTGEHLCIRTVMRHTCLVAICVGSAGRGVGLKCASHKAVVVMADAAAWVAALSRFEGVGAWVLFRVCRLRRILPSRLRCGFECFSFCLRHRWTSNVLIIHWGPVMSARRGVSTAVSPHSPHSPRGRNNVGKGKPASLLGLPTFPRFPTSFWSKNFIEHTHSDLLCL